VFYHVLLQRVLSHQEDQALLKAYIAEWRKFFTQCDYLPTPFRQLESSLAGKTLSSVAKKPQNEESIVRKVSILYRNAISTDLSVSFKIHFTFLQQKFYSLNTLLSTNEIANLYSKKSK
jgi:hypothetical protein